MLLKLNLEVKSDLIGLQGYVMQMEGTKKIDGRPDI